MEETTAQIEETAPTAEEKSEAVTVVEDITVEATEEYIEATFDNNYIEYYFRTENQLEQHFQKSQVLLFHFFHAIMPSSVRHDKER